jgi:predicted RNase H-like HicB family nuclease
MQLTYVFQKSPSGWYIGWVEEVPGANTQGATLDEARRNLTEALEMVLESRRELAAREFEGQDLLREGVPVGAP